LTEQTLFSLLLLQGGVHAATSGGFQDAEIMARRLMVKSEVKYSTISWNRRSAIEVSNGNSYGSLSVSRRKFSRNASTAVYARDSEVFLQVGSFGGINTVEGKRVFFFIFDLLKYLGRTA